MEACRNPRVTGMKNINAQQLALLLDIKVSDAKDKIVACIFKKNGEVIPRMTKKQKKEFVKDYPGYLPVKDLSEHLGIPNLDVLIEDIHENFLKRNATKKYILSDHPEKHIKSCEKAGKLRDIKIPPGLKSFLKQSDIDFIHQKWRERYAGWYTLFNLK